MIHSFKGDVRGKYLLVHSQKKGTKAVTWAVPFQEVHFTQRLHIGTVVHIST